MDGSDYQSEVRQIFVIEYMGLSDIFFLCVKIKYYGLIAINLLRSVGDPNSLQESKHNNHQL